MTRSDSLDAACRCGKVVLEAHGAPIIGATCHCRSCQTAGTGFEAVEGAPPVLDARGGTEYLLYRKDRVACTAGEAELVEHRLSPESATRRVVASCCNSPMFLEFSKGHWLSLYRARFTPEAAPPIEIRTMTADARDGAVLPGDVPNLAGHSGKFMWKLLTAWVAMGFRVPKVVGELRKL